MWLLCALASAEEAFDYNPIGKRDPFAKLVTELPTAPKEGLMAWEIDDLDLVGVTSGLEGPAALFMTPDGQSWVVGEGTYVGRFWGVVTRIDEDSVHIQEEYMDLANEGLIIKPYVLELHQGE